MIEDEMHQVLKERQRVVPPFCVYFQFVIRDQEGVL